MTRRALKPNPAPKEVNDVRLIETGIVVWTMAFVVTAFTVGPGRAMGVTICGIALGFYGRRYTRRRRATLTR